MAKEKKSEKWTREEKVMLGVVVVIVLVLAAGIYYKFLRNPNPAIKINAIEVTGSCENCFDTKLVYDYLAQQQNIEVKDKKSFDYRSKEGQKLIEEYRLTRIPSVILTGKLDKLSLDEQVFKKTGDALVFNDPVPYLDINSGEVRGIVELIELYDPLCLDCLSLAQLGAQFEKVGVKTGNFEKVASNSDKGKKLIEENDLKFLPVLFISNEIEVYEGIFSSLQRVLDKKGELYMYNQPIAPYKDIVSGVVKGKVAAIYLENKSCSYCYNVTMLKGGFVNLGVFISEERNVEISSYEGKSLINIYKITAVPTIIFSKELKDYTSLNKTLSQFGTFESDGKFVFRQLDTLNVKYQKIDSV